MKNLTILLVWVLAFQVCHAQIKATTPDGKTVILEDDGTWHYEKVTVTNQLKPASSSDCSTLVRVEEDEVTGRVSIFAPERTIVVSKDQKNGLGLYWTLFEKQSIVMLIIKVVGDTGCIDDDAQINILFTDGSRATLTQSGKFNCDGDATLAFGGFYGKKKELETLTTKRIKTIRVWGNRGYVQEDFTPEQGELLMRSGRCMASRI